MTSHRSRYLFLFTSALSVLAAAGCIRTSNPFEMSPTYITEIPRPGTTYSASVDISFRLSSDAALYYVVTASGSAAPSLAAFTAGAPGIEGVLSRGTLFANSSLAAGIVFPHASASYEIFFAAGRDSHVTSAIERITLSFTASGISNYGWWGKGGTTVGWHTNGSGELGATGTAAGEFNGTYGVAVAPNGWIYVVDANNNRIQIFSAPGVYLSSFGTAGPGDGQLFNPRDIALDNSGNVYVIDTGNHRMQKFSATGSFISKIGGNGMTDGKFNSPQALTLDNSGNIYVVDGANARIQKFSADGTILGWWGKGSVTSGWHNPGSGETGTSGSGPGEFNSPYGIAYDPAGYIYTIELGSRRLQKFSTSGTYLTEWGGSGSGDGLFDMPQGLCVDPAGYVIVADTLNDRICKFSSSGSFIGWFGNDSTAIAKWHAPGSGFNGNFPGSSDGQLNSPARIVCDAAGKIYVADQQNHRIQVFR